MGRRRPSNGGAWGGAGRPVGSHSRGGWRVQGTSWACVPAPGLRPWLSYPYPRKWGHTASSASAGVCLWAPSETTPAESGSRGPHTAQTTGHCLVSAPFSPTETRGLPSGGICVRSSVLQEDPWKGSVCGPSSYRKGGPREGSVCSPPSYRKVLGRDLCAVLCPTGKSSGGICLWSSVLQEGWPSGGICVQSSVLQESPREGSVCGPLSYRKVLGRDLCVVLHPTGRSSGGICLWSSVL